MKRIIDYILWFIWFPLRNIVLLIPQKITYSILSFCSFLLYLADSKRRNGVNKELEMLYGNRFSKREIRKIAISSFDLFFKRLFENLYFSYKKMDIGMFNKIASIEGFEHVKAALEKGNGVLLIQFHFGSFLLILLALSLRGVTINALAGTPLKESSYIKNKMVEFRDKEKDLYPFKVLTINSSLLPVVRALKNNEAIGVTIDGRQGANWVPVRLFDRTALFSTGLIDLSMRTGAVILPLAIVMGPDKRHRIIIEPPMELTADEDRGKMLRINVERFIRNYEKYLLNYPDHYAMTLYNIREEVRRGINTPLFAD